MIPYELKNQWREPTAVVVTMRDGSVIEMPFATRFLAEMYLYQLPYLALTLQDGDEVASAILSPLRVVDTGSETGM